MADTMEKTQDTVGTNGSANGAAKSGGGKVRVKFENSKFVIHPDVVELGIPTQTSDEYETLRDDIRKNGFRDAVRMTRDPETRAELLVDGNHRMNIADEFGFVDMKDGKLVILNKDRAPRVEWVSYDEAVSVAVSASLRRNLTDAQKAQMAMRLLEVEKLQAKRRQQASARISNMMKQVDKPRIVEVDYERLTKKGDIGATFSQDSVMVTSRGKNSILRGLFDYDGRKLCAVDGMLGSRLVCYGIERVDVFKDNGGLVTNYVARAEEWARGENQGNYDGIFVSVEVDGQMSARCLVGPPIIFAPSEESIPKAADAKGKKVKGQAQEGAKGGEDKAKGKASEKVGAAVGMSARTIEMMEAVKNEDPDAYQRIIKNEPIPGTNGTLETVNSAYNRVVAARKAAQSAEDKEESDRLPNPDDLTPEEFLNRHPLFKELGENAEFKAAVGEWAYLNKAIASAKMQAGKSGLNGRKPKDAFGKAVMEFASIKHPYEWTTDGKGGFKTR